LTKASLVEVRAASIVRRYLAEDLFVQIAGSSKSLSGKRAADRQTSGAIRLRKVGRSARNLRADLVASARHSGILSEMTSGLRRS
jgi:hypothetical protein